MPAVRRSYSGSSRRLVSHYSLLLPDHSHVVLQIQIEQHGGVYSPACGIDSLPVRGSKDCLKIPQGPARLETKTTDWLSSVHATGISFPSLCVNCLRVVISVEVEFRSATVTARWTQLRK